MTEFSATVFQNEFLPVGATDAHAIVGVTCSGAGRAGHSGAGDAAEVVVVDISGSMQVPGRMRAAQDAAVAALEQILDGTWFAVVAGNHQAYLAYPVRPLESWMSRMSPTTRAEAVAAVRRLEPAGGTAMGTWLELTGRVFATVPSAAQRHAILLTDGRNEHETRSELDARLATVTGAFQCDCRGIGADWEVGEVRRIAQALLGTVDLIPTPAEMPAEFERLMRAAMARGVAAAELRVWTPQGAQVLFVRQVAPEVEDLTARRTDVNPLTGGYPTGSWGDETREYHVAVRLAAAREVGSEQLAARVQLAVGGEVRAQGLVKAMWTDDDALSARISPEVAHYTGQTELAAAIQDGLAAKAAGDEGTATAKLGRAVQLAAATGNDEATARLRKVVDIDEAATGKVRLKQAVERLDEMALDTASTKTSRVRR
ncbi:VWA domain-containing protein [Aquipuribacter nitratireducens]|uniref:VWA domain-containing protein n=1 Tax=Aquipuribacter nitratireducens TaxID=650104 RepID=A0ABW0GL62_9MICO